MRASSWTFPHPHSKHPPALHNAFWILAPLCILSIATLDWVLMISIEKCYWNDFQSSLQQSPHHLMPPLTQIPEFTSQSMVLTSPKKWYGVVALKSDSPVLKSAACLLRLWVSYLSSLCLNFHIRKTVILTMLSRLLWGHRAHIYHGYNCLQHHRCFINVSYYYLCNPATTSTREVFHSIYTESSIISPFILLAHWRYIWGRTGQHTVSLVSKDESFPPLWR